MSDKKIKIASLQVKAHMDKNKDLANLEELISLGKALNSDGELECISNADMVVLPEMWNCPYRPEVFAEYAEPEGGAFWQACSDIARKYGIYLSAGSIPELGDDGKIYNTAFVFGRDGRQLAKHRKVHMFDIYSSEGKAIFLESEVLGAGTEITTFDTEWCRMGLQVCFDIRFPEMARLQALKGAEVILLPATFSMATGKAHWEVNLRVRAMENQVFMVATAPARDPESGYTSWSHSTIVDPWGQVIMRMEENVDARITELDLGLIEKYRRKLPMITARREDVYKLR